MAQGAGKKIVLSPHADGSTGWIDLLKGGQYYDDWHYDYDAYYYEGDQELLERNNPRLSKTLLQTVRYLKKALK